MSSLASKNNNSGAETDVGPEPSGQPTVDLSTSSGLTASMSGIDLADLARLRDHLRIPATAQLNEEQFQARSVDYVPESARAEAREFVSSRLLVKDPDEQNAHLYKFRLKDYNPTGEGLDSSEWAKFNDRLNARAGRVRVLDALESTTGLSQEVLATRNLEFIDARHQPEALNVFIPSRTLVTDPDQKLQVLHHYYDKNRSSAGRFESSAWDYFNRAANYVDALVESGKPIDARAILEINSLLQNGEFPERITTIIRDRYDIMGVFRPSTDLERVFDAQGQYRSDLFSSPPMLGFCSRKQFLTGVAQILKKINEEKPDLPEFRQLIEQVRNLTTLNPSDVAGPLNAQLMRKLQNKHGSDTAAIQADLGNPDRYSEYKRVQVLSSIDRAALKTHLNTVLEEYTKHVKALIAEFGSPQKLATEERRALFQRQVVRLATEFGSVIDMGHFAMDGMGRTNLQLERAVMGQFGLTRGAPIEVTFDGAGYENGTYVPKNVRIDAILATLDPLDVKEAVARMESLGTSIMEERHARLKVTESDKN